MMRGVADQSRGLSRDEKLAILEGKMLAGEFVRGDTARAYAREWNQSLDGVQQLTAEASRRVRTLFSADSVAAYAHRHLADTVVEARADGKHADVVAALRLMADISGAKAPQRLEATVSTLSPDQARERLRELAPALVDALKEPT